MPELRPGDLAPRFDLTDQDGKRVSADDLQIGRAHV